MQTFERERRAGTVSSETLQGSRQPSEAEPAWALAGSGRPSRLWFVKIIVFEPPSRAYPERMDRRVFDALAEHHGLASGGVERMLELAGARPSRAELSHFAVRVLHLGGVLSVAAGVVFFEAANWSAFDVFGRFALVQAVLLLAVAVALWRPPPAAVGRYALLLAFIVTGALFALYGQTYQTGADVYELFLNWALLGLAFVVAAQWSVAWAAWVLVLNVALLLFCAARPDAGILWLAFGSWALSTSQLLLLPLGVNLFLWGLWIFAQRSRAAHLAPRWLVRFTLACAVGSGTLAALVVIVGNGDREGAVGLIAPLLVFTGLGLYTLRGRRDVFPLALIEGSLILLSTVWIGESLVQEGFGGFFLISAWLILTSTVSGHYLMRLVRRWGVHGSAT